MIIFDFIFLIVWFKYLIYVDFGNILESLVFDFIFVPRVVVFDLDFLPRVLKFWFSIRLIRILFLIFLFSVLKIIIIFLGFTRIESFGFKFYCWVGCFGLEGFLFFLYIVIFLAVIVGLWFLDFNLFFVICRFIKPCYFINH